LSSIKNNPCEEVAPAMEALAAEGKLTAHNADLHWLYEQSVQNVEAEVEFIDRVFKKEFGRTPGFLREDFCGTAQLCSEWVKRRRSNTALGVDYDGPTLEWGRANNLCPLGDRASAVTLVQDDVRNVTDPRAEVLAATNFSWWGFKTRAELKEYFLGVHASLQDEGMLLLDIYGGPEAQVPQIEEKDVEGFEYLWDQDDFNPITGEVRCMIHFRFPNGSQMDNAFTYDWRLWSLPETCDLLEECGYRKVVVFWEGTDKDGEPNGIFLPDRKGDLAPAWVAYIIAYR
jgi:hypothetical protein